MTETSQDNILNYIHFLKHSHKNHMYWEIKVQRRNMPHFKSFAMINLLLLVSKPHSVTCRAWICNCSNLLWPYCPSYLLSLAAALLLCVAFWGHCLTSWGHIEAESTLLPFLFPVWNLSIISLQKLVNLI